MTEPAPPLRPAAGDTQASAPLWEQYHDTTLSLAVAAGLYVEAVRAAAGAERVEIHFHLMAEAHAKRQAVRIALGLVPTEGGLP